jgi:hypothetical protein
VHAGVPAIGRTVAGTRHAGDLIMPGVLPELYEASTRNVTGFAKSLV